jgi:hypothetical protein
VAENGNRSTTEQLVAVPALQSLISGLAGAAMFGVMAAGVQLMLGGETDWRFLVLGGLAVGVTGFLAMWVLLMLAHWPRRERVARVAPVAVDVSMPVIPLAFDARDARRFINDTLICVNGEWRYKNGDGSNSQREMQGRGWSRADWDAAKAWLLEHGILEWKNPAAHQQGMQWNWERLDRFVGRRSGE